MASEGAVVKKGEMFVNFNLCIVRLYCSSLQKPTKLKAYAGSFVHLETASHVDWKHTTLREVISRASCRNVHRTKGKIT